LSHVQGKTFFYLLLFFFFQEREEIQKPKKESKQFPLPMADFPRLSVALSGASIYNVGLSLGITVPLFLILRLLIDYAKVLSLRRRMPPGPFPLPLFGNYFSIPGERPWLKFEEWSTKTYKSPLITIWNGTAPTILCNDAWSISDLLDKRASIYSSRPRCVLMGDCTGATTTNQILQPYGDRWRLHRRLTVSIFYFFFRQREPELTLLACNCRTTKCPYIPPFAVR
jgi:hypothetical protein